tara:strand:- start:1512 stop:3101 length:1590 start_codon:yes stop_codon:yes gene_type:complete
MLTNSIDASPSLIECIKRRIDSTTDESQTESLRKCIQEREEIKSVKANLNKYLKDLYRTIKNKDNYSSFNTAAYGLPEKKNTSGIKIDNKWLHCFRKYHFNHCNNKPTNFLESDDVCRITENGNKIIPKEYKNTRYRIKRKNFISNYDKVYDLLKKHYKYKYLFPLEDDNSSVDCSMFHDNNKEKEFDGDNEEKEEEEEEEFDGDNEEEEEEFDGDNEEEEEEEEFDDDKKKKFSWSSEPPMVKESEKYFNVPTDFQHKKSAADLESDIKLLYKLILENEKLMEQYSNNPSKRKYHTDLKNKDIKRQIIAQGLYDDIGFRGEVEQEKKDAYDKERANPKNTKLFKELLLEELLDVFKKKKGDELQQSNSKKKSILKQLLDSLNKGQQRNFEDLIIEEMSDKEKQAFRSQKGRDIKRKFGPERKPVIKTFSNYTTPKGGRKKRTTKKKKILKKINKSLKKKVRNRKKTKKRKYKKGGRKKSIKLSEKDKENIFFMYKKLQNHNAKKPEPAYKMYCKSKNMVYDKKNDSCI